MTTNSKLVSDIEALLEVAKTYDVEKADRTTKLDLMAKIEALHTDLDDPVEAMFRQITNVRLFYIPHSYADHLESCSIPKLQR
jgi:hypothetical protein